MSDALIDEIRTLERLLDEVVIRHENRSISLSLNPFFFYKAQSWLKKWSVSLNHHAHIFTKIDWLLRLAD